MLQLLENLNAVTLRQTATFKPICFPTVNKRVYPAEVCLATQIHAEITYEEMNEQQNRSTETTDQRCAMVNGLQKRREVYSLNDNSLMCASVRCARQS